MSVSVKSSALVSVSSCASLPSGFRVSSDPSVMPYTMPLVASCVRERRALGQSRNAVQRARGATRRSARVSAITQTPRRASRGSLRTRHAAQRVAARCAAYRGRRTANVISGAAGLVIEKGVKSGGHAGVPAPVSLTLSTVPSYAAMPLLYATCTLCAAVPVA